LVRVLISKKLKFQIKACEVDAEFELWTDHQGVVLKLKLKKKFKVYRPPKVVKPPKITRNFNVARENGAYLLDEVADKFDELAKGILEEETTITYEVIYTLD
jgi:hypothetical protein